MMSTELQMLFFTLILGLVQIVLQAGAASQQRSLQFNMSARDTTPAPLTGIPGRIDRALQNFKENFPFFIAAVLLVQLTNRTGGISAAGAQVFFWSRLIYVPIYAFGIPVVRTLVWTISIIGIVMMLSALF